MSEWKMLRIDDVATIFDGPHATPKKTAEGPWFLSISSLDKGRLNLPESAHLSNEDYDKWTRRVTPQEGDVLFSYETRLGEAALMPGGIQACLGRRMGLLRPRRDVVDPRFLLYFYLSAEFQGTISARKIQGATVDRIPLVSMGTWPVRIPGLDAQKEICDLLGALDDKIAVNERIVTTALELADVMFTEASQQRHEHTTLGSLARDGRIAFGDGYRTKRQEHGQPGLPILRVAEVHDNEIRPTMEDFVRSEFSRSIGPKVSQIDDVIVTTKGTVGRVALVRNESPQFVYSPQICYFRILETSFVSVPYLFHWFRGNEFRTQANKLKSNTDMADYLSLRDVRSLTISIPERQTLEDFNARVDPLRAMMDQKATESRTLAHLRDILLPQLMSGRIRVRDAESIMEDAT